MKATIIAIGDELLIGQVLDTNSQWIARQCTELNIEIVRKTTVSDGIEPIVAAIQEGVALSDIIIMTGGLGPTSDDYTPRAIAEYFGMEIKFHPPTWERILAYFLSRGREPNEALKAQALLPERITFLVNDMGTAPGMYHHWEDKHLVSFPGVPYEMKHLFTDRFVPIIKPYLGDNHVKSRTILTVGKGETDIATVISDIESNLDSRLSIAYLPDIGRVRVRITGRDTNGEDLNGLINRTGDAIIDRLKDSVYGEGELTLSEAIRDIMVEKGLTLGLAESCTGGNISRQVVSASGSSAYYKGGIVSYSNQAKQSLLGVSPDSLEQYGAVSEQVAKEMAEGALNVFHSDIAASVTGIAGPDGGSESKPVGTFWVGLAMKDKETRAFKINFNRDRERNIEFVSIFVMNTIRMSILSM